MAWARWPNSMKIATNKPKIWRRDLRIMVLCSRPTCQQEEVQSSSSTWTTSISSKMVNNWVSINTSSHSRTFRYRALLLCRNRWAMNSWRMAKCRVLELINLRDKGVIKVARSFRKTLLMDTTSTIQRSSRDLSVKNQSSTSAKWKATGLSCHLRTRIPQMRAWNRLTPVRKVSDYNQQVEEHIPLNSERCERQVISRGCCT